MQRSEAAEGFHLDCYPYTFSPLLLFASEGYFDKVRRTFPSPPLSLPPTPRLPIDPQHVRHAPWRLEKPCARPARATSPYRAFSVANVAAPHDGATTMPDHMPAISPSPLGPRRMIFWKSIPA